MCVKTVYRSCSSVSGAGLKENFQEYITDAMQNIQYYFGEPLFKFATSAVLYNLVNK